MAKPNLNTVQSQKPQWTVDTADYFKRRLDGNCSILTALCSNISEYEKDDGRASDEALVLAIQHVLSVTAELEKLSYDLDDAQGPDNLPLQLMWARALLEIIEGMSSVGGWEINLSNAALGGCLGAVDRILRKASDEAQQIHDRKFFVAPTVSVAK